MATLIHFDKDDEFTEEDWDGMGIGIGHRDDIPEDTFEGMGIGIGHKDDKVMINEIVEHDDFFDIMKAEDERYVKERNWLTEVKKFYTPEVLNIKRQSIPVGSSKVAHYNNIVKEVQQRAQSIGATYLICASNWLPIFSLS